MSANEPDRSSANEDEAIRDVIARWHRATAAGDIESILELMTDDVVFVTPGSAPMIGRGNFEAGLRALLKTHRIESSGDVQELVVSGDMAYCITHLSVRVRPTSGGDPLVRTGFTLSVFRKQANGRWQLARDANLLPPGGKS